MPWDWLGSRLPIFRKSVAAARLPANAEKPPVAPRRSARRGGNAATAELVVPRADHPISRKSISPNALRVLYRLRDAGYAGYLVGGAVRDLLVGIQPKDFDVATDAKPEQVRQLFRNCRLIGRRFRLAHIMFGSEIIEVATFRAGGDDGSGDRSVVDGRIVRDNVYGSIEDDAERRDFTVNALYYAIEDFSLRDFVGGFADIERRSLRLIGEPDERYREDPVRMLRAVRLATKLGFEIEPGTLEPIPRLAGLLDDAAPARLFDESLKLLLGGHARAGFAALEKLGLLRAILPATAGALTTQTGAALRPLLDAALEQTDQRVRDGRSVGPAFLFAALLWPAAWPRFMALRSEHHEVQVAWGIAADEVLVEQVRRAALPRRFSLPMLEIWQLQSRFENQQRKRVLRLLEHPRFRAAYDFLELRAAFDPEAAEHFAFWRDLEGKPEPNQQGPRRGPRQDVHGEGDAGEDSEGTSPPRRRRRGGRGRRSGSSPSPGSSE